MPDDLYEERSGLNVAPRAGLSALNPPLPPPSPPFIRFARLASSRGVSDDSVFDFSVFLSFLASLLVFLVRLFS